jgi:hypothetical protein
VENIQIDAIIPAMSLLLIIALYLNGLMIAKYRSKLTAPRFATALNINETATAIVA